MFKTLQESKPPSLALSSHFRLKHSAGEAVDIVAKNGNTHNTFVTFSATTSKYRAQKAVHSGPYYLTRKVLIAVLLMVALAICTYAFLFCITNIDSDYIKVVDYPTYATSYDDCNWEVSFNHTKVWGCAQPHEDYTPIVSWVPHWSIMTYVKDAAYGVGALVSLIYAWSLTRLVPFQAIVLYKSLRTRFARLDTDIVRRIEGGDTHWTVLRSRIEAEVKKNDFVPKPDKKSRLADVLERLKGMTIDSFNSEVQSLSNKGNQLSVEPASPLDVVRLFTNSLHEGKPSLIGELCDNVASRYFVTISRLIDAKKGSSKAQKAKLDIRIRELADREAALIAPVLIKEVFERRLEEIEGRAEKLYLEECEHKNKDREIDALIESTNYLVTPADGLLNQM